MSAPATDDDELERTRAPFMEHLVELRRRLWYSVLTIGVCALAAYNYHNEIYLFLTAPLYDVMLARGLGDVVPGTIGAMLLFACSCAVAFAGHLNFSLLSKRMPFQRRGEDLKGFL
jgi:Sec-independent protein secretion pathway component TatC